MLGTAGLPADAVQPSYAALSADWGELLNQASWFSPELRAVALRCARGGLRVANISCITVVRPDCPELAPAIHFEQSNRDEVIVYPKGCLTVFGGMAERHVQFRAAGRAL
jgi:hypothetical protein